MQMFAVDGKRYFAAIVHGPFLPCSVRGGAVVSAYYTIADVQQSIATFKLFLPVYLM